MKIYLGHSRSYDYQNELYAPIRADQNLAQYDIVLPHEHEGGAANTRDFYRNLDLFIAEVSYPATGLGIELGWASDSHVPIVAISQAGAKVSGSIHAVTDQFYTYANATELTQLIDRLIQEHQN